jgi:hypothetical protein
MPLNKTNYTGHLFLKNTNIKGVKKSTTMGFLLFAGNVSETMLNVRRFWVSQHLSTLL